MWKLILSQGDDDPRLKSVNGHIGRQFWEFDANHGTPQERAHVEKLRQDFHSNRLQFKHSSDLLMRFQVSSLSHSFYMYIYRHIASS